jgi:hypothetical protein
MITALVIFVIMWAVGAICVVVGFFIQPYRDLTSIFLFFFGLTLIIINSIMMTVIFFGG